jgi:hypothetical protein
MASLLGQFGTVRPIDTAHVDVSRFGRVKGPQKGPGPRAHDQKVASPNRTWVRERVRDSIGSEDGGSRVRLNLPVAQAETKIPLEDVPRLVLIEVYVKGSDRLSGTRPVVRPLGEDEVGLLARVEHLIVERTHHPAFRIRRHTGSLEAVRRNIQAATWRNVVVRRSKGCWG